MKVIVYENGNGGVSVCRPAYEDRKFKELGLSEEQILAIVLEKDIPNDVRRKVIDESDLSLMDRTRRSEWKFCPGRGVKL